MSVLLNNYDKNFLTCGGIDGGDANADIWFVGVEWAAREDMIIWQKKWQETEPSVNNLIPDINIPDEINDWLDKSCILEHRMGLIIGELENIREDSLQKLAAKLVEKNKFFQAGSGYAKLNLYPLPFPCFDEHKNIKSLYPELGFETYDGYCRWCAQNRFPVFHNLISAKLPKVIICFGKTNREDFEDAFRCGKQIYCRIPANGEYKIELRRLENGSQYYIVYLPFPKNEHTNLLTNIGKQIKKMLQNNSNSLSCFTQNNF